MRFIITAQAADAPAAADAGLDEDLLAAYMRFNEEMHRAGVLVASEGLNPAAKGARVAVRDGKRHLVDEPFAESKELVGGFYIIEVASLEEAIGWALRAPCRMGSDDVERAGVAGAGLTPTQRQHDRHEVVGLERMPQVARAQAVDEQAHVGPQLPLLIHHAETQAGVAAVEVVEQRVERGALGLHVRVARVGLQRPGDQHLHRHHARSTTSTA